MAVILGSIITAALFAGRLGARVQLPMIWKLISAVVIVLPSHGAAKSIINYDYDVSAKGVQMKRRT